jgi:hypothetical protein
MIGRYGAYLWYDFKNILEKYRQGEDLYAGVDLNS